MQVRYRFSGGVCPHTTQPATLGHLRGYPGAHRISGIAVAFSFRIGNSPARRSSLDAETAMTQPSSLPISRESLQQIAADPDRVAALHGLVGEFCHLLRNRLNSLQVSMYLARHEKPDLEPRVWEELNHHYREAEGVIELFQTVVRPMSLSRISIEPDIILNEFTARWTARFLARGVILATDLPPANGPSWVDPSKIAQGLDALAAWRVNRVEAGSRITIGAWVGKGRSRIEWSEPTIPSREVEGELPLAALARITSAHGGLMTRDVTDGWRIVLEWPNAN